MRVIRKAGYTEVDVLDEPGAGNACHVYRVSYERGSNVIGFQNGPIEENGANGVQIEDLLAICIDRLQGFQDGRFPCRENAIALTKLEESLMWLDKRTADRKKRGVEGSSQE